MGLNRKTSIKSYWTEHHAERIPFIKKIMKYERWVPIDRMAHFVDAENANAPGGFGNKESSNYDPTARIRDFLREVTRSFRRCRFPTGKLSIDEKMLRCLTR